eukprot:CAMPEP_0179946610 /NCGR_PEP_ID=MMETSP0983-20121128/20468_1 /TAXON_ID=483367 /ORGANISM="non described non described, Strain CCMP 2436" /LENGTH=250 /DNA_ID=CAMNT_0021855443 /DNA_START=538 /DNA_END=1291 /DNA_ORIENTATION=-
MAATADVLEIEELSSHSSAPPLARATGTEREEEEVRVLAVAVDARLHRVSLEPLVECSRGEAEPAFPPLSGHRRKLYRTSVEMPERTLCLEAIELRRLDPPKGRVERSERVEGRARHLSVHEIVRADALASQPRHAERDPLVVSSHKQRRRDGKCHGRREEARRVASVEDGLTQVAVDVALLGEGAPFRKADVLHDHVIVQEIHRAEPAPQGRDLLHMHVVCGARYLVDVRQQLRGVAGREAGGFALRHA